MKAIIIRYSEIHLKGNNKEYFESALISNLKTALKGFDLQFGRSNARYVLRNFDESLTPQIIDCVKNVFGVHSLSVAEEVPSTLEDIRAAAIALAPKRGSFKVSTNRADKRFPLHSMDLSAEIGGDVLENNSALTVNLHNPDHVINIDIRENGKTFVFRDVIRGVNGMPVGTGGKAVAMLSGGIDSPVAMYMMAKRGMSLRAVHFHSFPYTSAQAKQKVLDLAAIVKKYTLRMTVDVVSFTEIQTAIHERCPEEYMITIMRRFMMRIAEKLARINGCGAVVTGESLGQVASQTLESITSTNAVAHIPVFRPLIGFDKEEIIDIAHKIGTYETSILPYEDCCTIFLPKRPVTKPRLSAVEKVESALDVETLVQNALQNVETVVIE
ncbi:MAG TPA: tRNA 4-thiouridine(8) synthase ThiI [Candidatus Fimimonas merdipullorum]|uniref:Probable tRNA sulfurtransferase n=1 Tax=Candidatus Fimimonas merdipullorum TaxID=2840822 RepID=A0A9D1MWS0_9BACT|nr:tRNA 4-thiouridine(8) synthase ThiI [Candidatus Fimimonas merdipullorum]